MKIKIQSFQLGIVRVLRLQMFPLLFFSGCVAALIGVGAVSGYMVGQDYALGDFEVSYQDAWDVCIDRFK